ncbi:MAG TPA: ATP-binding protein [Acidimicrobiales bacterium]|nr:ATP-binding protein [Acidimicrobiales bacterium]
MAEEFSGNPSRDELANSLDVVQLEAQKVDHIRLEDIVKRHASALDDSEVLLQGRAPTFDNVLLPLLDVAVPSLSDWCYVDFVDELGAPRKVTIRHRGLGHESREGESEDCYQSLLARVPGVAQITARVGAGGASEVWPQLADSGVPWCVVVGLRVNNVPFGTITFVTEKGRPGLGPPEIAVAEEIARTTSKALERTQLRLDARESVRRTQHIASQLHQLIAASFTVNALSDEDDIASSVAASAQSVFGADNAMVSLEGDRTTPLRVIAHRGKHAASTSAHDEFEFGNLPKLRVGVTVPWIDGDWLVAPVLERRDRARGVVAIRRESGPPFSAEDVEVLTLLAQTASTALGAAQMSRTIHNSEARWRALVETAPVGIVEIDAARRVRWWNQAASKIFSWPEPTGDLETLVPRFPEAAWQELRSLWSDVLNGGAGLGRDFLDVEIGARRRDLTASAVLLPLSGDGSRGILTLVDDVTDQREMATENRFAHRMEIRGQVASNLAHDFNNLLTLISGYAEILSQNLASDEHSLKMVTDIQATAQRASGLTGQLLAIGRTKAVEPVVVDPVAAIESISEVLDRILGVDISVVWSLDPESPSIFVDADQFEQMMLNLALNARDAMAAGGQLSISVDDVTLGTPAAPATDLPAGKYVQIKVADTGHGMDEETRRRCFEPMFTTKGPFKGSGLGLSAARRLVEESRGVIRCSSELGHGTTFEIILPATTQAVVRSSPLKSPDQPPRSTTVLLAEDDEDLRRLIGQVLRRIGYHVLEASTGEQAIEVARGHDGAVHLLLSDVIMPTLSGRDVALTLQEENPDLLVLLISGSEDATVLDGLYPASAAFLSKPFKPSELIDQMLRLLAR